MGVSHIRGKKKGILGKENSMCKGPGAGKLAYQEASVAGAEKVRRVG